MKRAVLFSVIAAAAMFLGLGTPGLGGKSGTSTAEAAFPGADNVVVVNRQCMADGSVAVSLAWQSSGLGIQWVDVARVNGFFGGGFSGVGPLSPFQNSITLSGLSPNSTFFVRVNTLTPFGWVATQTVSFFSDCQFAFQPFFNQQVFFVQVPLVRCENVIRFSRFTGLLVSRRVCFPI